MTTGAKKGTCSLNHLLIKRNFTVKLRLLFITGLKTILVVVGLNANEIKTIQRNKRALKGSKSIFIQTPSKKMQAKTPSRPPLRSSELQIAPQPQQHHKL
ncbi:hypothetical protein THF5H11_90142 [Vibrio jasicida]|nr:hypothetical protein THF5H11_90142 [Vibrio jasicida]